VQIFAYLCSTIINSFEQTSERGIRQSKSRKQLGYILFLNTSGAPYDGDFAFTVHLKGLQFELTHAPTTEIIYRRTWDHHLAAKTIPAKLH